jgi:hypothetical protein
MRGHVQASRRHGCLEAQLSELSRGDYGSGQLDDFLFTVQRLLGLGLHVDDPYRPGYLKLQVGVARDGHELDVTWLPQDDVIRPREVNQFEREHFWCSGYMHL